MAFPGAKFAWNGIAVHLDMPASGETVNSEWFSVPGGTKVLVITVGALVGAAATVQVLRALG